jgi:Ran GTPase-activating protein (RanGAP) involved in mRNA processing and transport
MDLLNPTGRVPPAQHIVSIVAAAVKQIESEKNPANIMLLDLAPQPVAVDDGKDNKRGGKTTAEKGSRANTANVDPSLVLWTPPATLEPPPKPSDTATHINLSGLRIGAAHCRSISRAMILNTSVVVLDLTACDMTDAGSAELFSCLSRNKTLEQLVIAGNHLTPAAAPPMADYLKLPKCPLKGLVVACNNLGDAGTVALAGSLATNRSLEFLNLRANGVTDEAAKVLMEQMKPDVNTTLLTAWMNLNHLSEAVTAELLQLHILKCPPPPDTGKKKKGKKGAKK